VILNGIRVLMGSGQFHPVDNIEAIAATLRNWRRQGIYCVANTSTLPGCEVPTIKNTLGNSLPGCFDALVLPRNHHAVGKITKAYALDSVASEAGVPLYSVPLVHIDDAQPHIESFRTYYAGREDMRLLSPVHYLQPVTDPELQSETPVAAFFRATEFFRQTGVIS